MSRSTLILLLVVGTLAALSSWLSREEESDPLSAARALPHVPDYYIAGFSAAAYSPQGSPRHRLSAERMTHYADDRTTELRQLQLAIFGDAGEQWQLAAGSGAVDAGGDLLQLADTVTMRRDGAAADALELRTGQLTVKTRERFATTRTPVTISGPRTHIEAAGLDAYFAEERLVLYSVRGRYEP